jgi:hypothetical protein
MMGHVMHMWQGKTITALSLVACSPRDVNGRSSRTEPAGVEGPARQGGTAGQDKETEASTMSEAGEEDMPAGGTLIVCPRSVLATTWEAEIAAKMVHARLFCHVCPPPHRVLRLLLGDAAATS